MPSTVSSPRTSSPAGISSGSPEPSRGAGVLGEEEVDVDGAGLPEAAAGQDLPGLQDGGEGVAVPHEEPHAGRFHGGDDAVALRQTQGHRLVLDDVQAGLGGGRAQPRVASGLRGDAGHAGPVPVQGRGDAAHVRQSEGGGRGLVALVHPLRRLFLVGQGRQLEAGMGRQSLHDVEVLDAAQDKHGQRLRRAHGAPRSACRPPPRRKKPPRPRRLGAPRPRPRRSPPAAAPRPRPRRAPRAPGPAPTRRVR